MARDIFLDGAAAAAIIGQCRSSYFFSFPGSFTGTVARLVPCTVSLPSFRLLCRLYHANCACGGATAIWEGMWRLVAGRGHEASTTPPSSSTAVAYFIDLIACLASFSLSPLPVGRWAWRWADSRGMFSYCTHAPCSPSPPAQDSNRTAIITTRIYCYTVLDTSSTTKRLVFLPL